MSAESTEIQVAKAIQVTPFPIAESGRTGTQMPLCFSHLRRKPFLIRHPEVDKVEPLLGLVPLLFGFLRFTIFAQLARDCFGSVCARDFGVPFRFGGLLISFDGKLR